MDALTTMARRVEPPALTIRQRQAAALVENYVAVAQEMPSAGWLGRRLSISRQRARELMTSIERKGHRITIKR